LHQQPDLEYRDSDEQHRQHGQRPSMTKPHEVRTFRFFTSPRNWFARWDTPHTVVKASASSTIRLLIFESPYSRSMKVIGTSTTRKPAFSARQARSTWKQYAAEGRLCSPRPR